MSHTQPREPNDGEFDAIVASNLTDLAALNTDTPHTAPAADQPATPAPVEHQTVETVPPRPPEQEPSAEPTPPRYWGEQGLAVVYWIAIITGAVGQTLAYGQLFGLGIPGYMAAAICATTLESAMVTATAKALTKRVAGHVRRRWVPFLVAGFVAAFGAAALNLLHWHTVSASLAVLFSGIALLGYVLHVMDGIGEGTRYLDRKADWDAETARQRRHVEQREQAAYERRLAEWETQQQATRRAITAAEPTTERSKPTAPAPKKPKATSGSKPAPTEAQIAQCWRNNDRPGAGTLRKLLAEQGFDPGGESTLRKKIAVLRNGDQ